MTMTFAPETYERTRETIRRLAERDFSRHLLEATGDREWWCHQPGTGIGSFRVIVRGGTVVIFGDVGTGIFRGGEAGDTLAWLRRAVGSPSYLLEKLQRRQDEFYPGDALDAARERARDDDERYAAKWQRVLEEAECLERFGELHRYSWAELVMEHANDVDCCTIGLSHASGDLWLIEALRWFVEHLPGDGTREGGRL